MPSKPERQHGWNHKDTCLQIQTNNTIVKQNANMKASRGRCYRVGFETEGRESLPEDELKKSEMGLRTRKMYLKCRRILFFPHWLGSQASLNYKLLLATSNNYSKQDTGPGIKGRSDFSALCTAIHKFFDIRQTGLKGKGTLMRQTVVESRCLPSMHKGFLANLSLPLHPL